MKKSILVSLIIILVTGISFTTSAQNVKKIKKEIEKINNISTEAMINGDVGSMNEYYTDDVIHMPDMSPMVKGKEAILKSEKEFASSGIKVLSFNLNTLEVFISGDYAYEIGLWDMSMEIPGLPEPWKDNGKYVSIWEIEKGNKVKMKLDIWNTDNNPYEAMQGMKGHEHDVDHN